MNIKRVVFSVLLVIWMVVIFLFSNQPANVSKGQSSRVASSIIETVSTITKKEFTENEKQTFIENSQFLVRKTAHFSLYFVLNLIAYFALKSYGVKHSFLYSILFSFIYACTDEIHQLFVAERAGRIFDVFIDTCGAGVSSFMIYFILLFKNKRKKKNFV